MDLNPSPAVRKVLYVLTAVGTPLVAYLLNKEIIGDMEMNLWAAEVTVISLMAGFNVKK